MSKIFGWIKKNKLASLLLIVTAYFLYNSFVGRTYNYAPQYQIPSLGVGSAAPFGALSKGVDTYSQPSYDSTPNLNVKDRIVIQESYLSLLVKDVRSSQNQIVNKAEELGGYMVNTNLQNPEEAATATVIVRIPSKKLNEALESFRGLAVKVTSENLQGTDVTDQYVDIKARMATLLQTKTKFESILDKATQVNDILNVQRELINLQSQIDSLKGQEDYISKNAEAAKITIYLSTDEFSLPYTPTESWRPEVIMKEAVRSLISTFRKIGTLLIWVLIYSIIWVPLLLVYRYYKHIKKSQQTQTN